MTTRWLIDFDSTLVQAETLEVLGEIALAADPDRDAKLEAIRALTDRAMAGELAFLPALEQRLQLLSFRREHLVEAAARLREHLSPSAFANRRFFRDAEVWVVSGGFEEIIVPVVEVLGIPADRVLANRFLYDGDRVLGADPDVPLSHDGGKAEAVRRLPLFAGDTVAVGDGWTDYEIFAAGLADRFYAFTETITRERVLAHAPHRAASFDDLLAQEGWRPRFTYPRDRIRVLLLENVHPAAAERFTDEGYAVETLPHALDPAALRTRLADVHVLGVRSKTALPAEALTNAPKLLAVGAFCIGTNHIDLPALAQRGVATFNAPYANTRSVVELAIAEIIALARGLTDKSRDLHAGRWSKTADAAYEIRGKTLGIVGYGAVGSQLSVLAEALGMRVIYVDLVEKLALGNARRAASLDALLAEADVVSLHVDGRVANTNLIGARELARMKPGALFLNLSRGHVADVPALAAAVRSNLVGGAAIDVFPEEPAANGDAFASPLQGLPNVILTPHVGGSTGEAQAAIAEFVTERLLGFLHRGDTSYSLNLPEVQLPEVAGAHRLLHVHENRPGALAAINGVLAARGVNILGQYLRTRDDVGYAVTDVDQDEAGDLAQAMRAIPGTLKFRSVY